MPEPPATGSGAARSQPPLDRLDSWKEIAAYLRRDVTTVQRWEKREAMPVHRHQHDRMGSVYAFRSELDAWARSRSLGETATGVGVGPGPSVAMAEAGAPAGVTEVQDVPASRPARRWTLVALGALVLLGLVVWAIRSRSAGAEDVLAGATFRPLTDFEGIEQAAAISRDGRFVAFQSDREGEIHVWVTQVGTGRFANLTRGTSLELVNPSVRTLGFSPDGSVVTFWGRARASAGAQPEISIWATPLLGGPARPYLEGVAEYDWSDDGAQLAYHTPGPGDPMFVRGAAPGSEVRKIFAAPAGLHSHFPIWSPDRQFLVFVQGSVPDRMDLWRIPAAGGAPERLTHHDARVSHPVFIDRRTLLYLAVDPDGSGPWIRSLDLTTRTSRRLGSPLDRYTSLSASADGRRLVATRAVPKTTFWRLALDAPSVDLANATRVPLTSLSGRSPRLAPGALFYVSSGGTGDGVWKLEGVTATELWSVPGARLLGAAVPSRDGRQVAFSVRLDDGRTTLNVVNADGTGVRELASGLRAEGTPGWAPDGQSLLVAAAGPKLVQVPLDGSPPRVVLEEHAADPMWSPDGDLVAFSGADIGTTFPVRLVNPDGSPSAFTLERFTRGARHLAFLPTGRAVLVLRGDIGHKNLYRVDLGSGAEQLVLELPADFDVRDFDLSPDGRELVLEQVKDNPDLILIELARR